MSSGIGFIRGFDRQIAVGLGADKAIARQALAAFDASSKKKELYRRG